MKPFLELYKRGVAKYKFRDYKGAIKDFTSEIKSNESVSPDTYVYRGLARYYIGDKMGALEDWLKAAELGDSDVYDLIDNYFN